MNGRAELLTLAPVLVGPEARATFELAAAALMTINDPEVSQEQPRQLVQLSKKTGPTAWAWLMEELEEAEGTIEKAQETRLTLKPSARQKKVQNTNLHRNHQQPESPKTNTEEEEYWDWPPPIPSAVDTGVKPATGEECPEGRTRQITARSRQNQNSNTVDDYRQGSSESVVNNNTALLDYGTDDLLQVLRSAKETLNAQEEFMRW